MKSDDEVMAVTCDHGIGDETMVMMMRVIPVVIVICEAITLPAHLYCIMQCVKVGREYEGEGDRRISLLS